MTYDMTIGEYYREDISEEGEEPHFWESARTVTLDEAPKFLNDDLTGRSNFRSAAYSGWSTFCEKHPIINDLMWGTGNGAGPLMPDHPGIADLKPEHLAAVREALKAHRAVVGEDTLPGYVPDATDLRFGGNYEPHDPTKKYDYALVRLLWMEWWMEWALANCERPVFSNS